MKLSKKQIIIISIAAALIIFAIILSSVIKAKNREQQVLIMEMERLREQVAAQTVTDHVDTDPTGKAWLQEQRRQKQEQAAEQLELLAEQFKELLAEQQDASNHCDITGFWFNGDYFTFGDSMTKVYDNMMHKPIPVRKMFSSYADMTMFRLDSAYYDWFYNSPQYSVESLSKAVKETQTIEGLSMYYNLVGNWKTANRVDYTFEFFFVSSKDSYEKKLALLEINYNEYKDAQEAIANFIKEYDKDGYTWKTLVDYMGESFEAHVQPDGNYFAFRDNRIIIVNNAILLDYADTTPPISERTAAPTDKLYYKGFWDIEAGRSFEEIYYAMQSRGWLLTSKDTWSLYDDQTNDDLMVISFSKDNGTYSNVAINSIYFYMYNNRMLFSYMPIDSSNDVKAIKDNCERRYELTDYDEDTAPEAVTWLFTELNYLPSRNPNIYAAKNSYYLGFKSNGMVSVNTDILDEYFRDVCGINTSMNDM